MARNRRKVKRWWSHLRKGDVAPVYAESGQQGFSKPDWTAEYGPHRGVLQARDVAGVRERQVLRPSRRSLFAWLFGAD